MILWLYKYYYRLQVKFLIIFNSTKLFDKINQLNWYQSMLHQWIDDLNLTADSKVLEAGCASGALTAYIDKLGCVPTGVDASFEMIELAKAKNKGIKFSVENILDLSFRSDCFDVILAASLINIVSDKNKAIKELARTCKNGGLISILVPAKEFDNNDLLSLQASLNNTGFSFAALEAWHNLAPKMKAEDIVFLFQQAGLTKIKTKLYLQGMVIAVSAEIS